MERRIVLKINGLYNKRQPHIENVQSRYSNKTVTLIVHSPKYSDRRVTKKTAQLQSIQPMGGSARVKSASRQFSWNKITLHMVHLEAVTVQLDQTLVGFIF